MHMCGLGGGGPRDWSATLIIYAINHVPYVGYKAKDSRRTALHICICDDL